MLGEYLHRLLLPQYDPFPAGMKLYQIIPNYIKLYQIISNVERTMERGQWGEDNGERTVERGRWREDVGERTAYWLHSFYIEGPCSCGTN